MMIVHPFSQSSYELDVEDTDATELGRWGGKHKRQK